MDSKCPETWSDFQRELDTEDSLLEYLRSLRWPNWPKGFACPKCRGSKAWTNKRSRLVCSACRHQTTVTAGTIFHRTHLSLLDWCRVAWVVANEPDGISAAELQQLSCLSRFETALACLRKLRCAMTTPFKDDGLKGTVMAAVGSVAVLGGREQLHAVHVVIAAETSPRGILRIRVARLAVANSELLRQFIVKAVEPHSEIYADGWEALEGAEHDSWARALQPLNYKFMGMSGRRLAQVRTVLYGLYSCLQGTHRRPASLADLDTCLAEYAFHYNLRRATSPGARFQRLMEQAVQTKRTDQVETAEEHATHPAEQAAGGHAETAPTSQCPASPDAHQA